MRAADVVVVSCSEEKARKAFPITVGVFFWKESVFYHFDSDISCIWLYQPNWLIDVTTLTWLCLSKTAWHNWSLFNNAAKSLHVHLLQIKSLFDANSSNASHLAYKCLQAAITCVGPDVNINLCRFHFLRFCDFWFPRGVLFFLYRSPLVVTTSLTPECPSVLSQFLFRLLTTSLTSKPHTTFTTAELLIWLSTQLLLSRHYIILNDHVDCGEHLCFWHKLLWCSYLMVHL